MSHTVSEYEKLAQMEYKRKHDVTRVVHWKLRGKYKLKKSKKWHEYVPKGVVKMKKWRFCGMLWKRDQAMEPDIVVVNKEVSEKERKKLREPRTLHFN